MFKNAGPCFMSCWFLLTCSTYIVAQDKPLVGLIPKAQQVIKIDGKLDDWPGAYVTPVHVGHPDFANRGGQFLYLWDDQNLYIGQRCLDQITAHIGKDNQIFNGDAVEFYLDTRRGDQLGAAMFTHGSLHMFWTGFTGKDVKPRWQIRELPVFKGLELKGVEVAAEKTLWGYTAEFKLPWANFPNFAAKAGEVIGIDCELCSSDGGARSDRTFVYSSPQSVSTPATFGRVQLVDSIDPKQIQALGKALLPMSLAKSANYDWLYGTIGLSPTIAPSVVRIEGKLLDADGKARKTSAGERKKLEGSDFELWTAKWELYDLPPGNYLLEINALNKANQPITGRRIKVLHDQSAAVRESQNPSPMVEHTRTHPRLTEEKPVGQREVLSLGNLFVPEKLKTVKTKVPLYIHFHGGTWLPEVAAARRQMAVITIQLGSGSAVYGKPFKDPKAFLRLLEEAKMKCNLEFGFVGLTGWSAGYGAIREILSVPENFARVQFVVLIDGLHTSYVGGKPGPRESTLVTESLAVFSRFADAAATGKKQMIITHSEIFPGTFASTTETTDYLLKSLQIPRQPTLQWGPMQTQQLSEARKGKFLVLGYAGNSAPDHVDQLHSLPDYLKWIERE